MEPISSPRRLQRHMAATYLDMRIGIAVIGLALPLYLWVVGSWGAGLDLQRSMSAYYHTPLRDAFVGALVSIGIALFLYRGFSRAENLALDLAGALIVCVAMFPTRASDEARTWINDVHLISAVLFFACIAYVSVFRASDTLSLIRDTSRGRLLRRVYRGLGAAMIASPSMAIVAAAAFHRPSEDTTTVFFMEAFGVWAFAAYWLVKSWEIRLTHADEAALAGVLKPGPATDRPREIPGRLVQTAPLENDDGGGSAAATPTRGGA